ncbi:uncharacterized protein LOC118935050 [Manis pentadactyla]|uniref:uncharacterized protein LOC118935050 n=1 Tax=Manis pentadactyla TaxID=143292 RepID=UPI00255CD7D5|nr:uncharacterized protein LOC118935050 [Manis pentadactyla]
MCPSDPVRQVLLTPLHRCGKGGSGRLSDLPRVTELKMPAWVSSHPPTPVIGSIPWTPVPVSGVEQNQKWTLNQLPKQIPSPQRLLACLEISPLRGPRSLTMSPSGSGLWAAALAQTASSGRPGLTSCSLPPSACPRPPRVPAAPAAPPGGSPRC